MSFYYVGNKKIVMHVRDIFQSTNNLMAADNSTRLLLALDKFCGLSIPNEKIGYKPNKKTFFTTSLYTIMLLRN